MVLGPRGHGRAAGLLLGSCSQYVSLHAHCPVVIVHPRAESVDRTRVDNQAAAAAT
jgi:hypothetical protein